MVFDLFIMPRSRVESERTSYHNISFRQVLFDRKVKKDEKRS